MTAIVVGGVALFAVLGVLLGIGTHEPGAIFVAPFLLFMVEIWLALEAWTHKYISRFAIFTRIGITEQGAPADADKPCR